MAYHMKESSPAAGRVLLVAVAVLLLAQRAGPGAPTPRKSCTTHCGRNGLTHVEDNANNYTRGFESSNKCRG